MNWLTKLANTYNGYKIVAYNGTNFYSLYSKQPLQISIGQILNFPKEGLFLGTTKQYCLDYFSGGTDDQDALITFQYDSNDLIKGEPEHQNGEVQVIKATITNIELLPKEE